MGRGEYCRSWKDKDRAVRWESRWAMGKDRDGPGR